MLIIAHNNTLNNLFINDKKKKNNIRHLFRLTLESYDNHHNFIIYRVNLHPSCSKFVEDNENNTKQYVCFYCSAIKLKKNSVYLFLTILITSSPSSTSVYVNLCNATIMYGNLSITATIA